MAFTFVAFSYILALIFTAFLIFFAIYHIIAFDELKTDYKNPIDQCNSLNPLVLPEYICHILFNVLFLFGFQWGSLMWNVPLIAYHVHRYLHRPVMSSPGLYDPTTIMNADQLNKAMREDRSGDFCEGVRGPAGFHNDRMPWSRGGSTGGFAGVHRFNAPNNSRPLPKTVMVTQTTQTVVNGEYFRTVAELVSFVAEHFNAEEFEDFCERFPTICKLLK